MSILLHGVDLVQVSRIEEMLEAHGDRFTARVFTEGEQAYAESAGSGRAERYAARFACKEAVFKVLGTGWGQGVAWTDVDVVRTASGRPELRVGGVAAERARELGVQSWVVSITHTAGLALASVVATGS
ncbi:MAG: holo-ACP synthase [Planctomycetota bacterium]|nr:holo-ACP synthase [Planctomycetota bacterium]